MTKTALKFLAHAALLLLAIVTLTPMLWLIAASLKEPKFIFAYTFFGPLDQLGETLSFYNFRNLFASVPFDRYVINSFFITCATVMIQLFLSSLGGFALAKYRFRGRRAVMLLMLLTMMLPGQVLLAPLYELIYRMGLVDSYAGLIVPGAVNVFGLFLFRQSMLSIPDDLLEAGRVDGCSEFRLYWTIALPVTRPMIAAFTLIAFMMAWNNFLWPQIILQTQQRFTLTIGLNNMVSVYEGVDGAIMAGTLLSVLPVVILFFALQKEFISGLTSGAVKA
jgi:ABC-type glycerol-3-phosphate transport system permease component